MLLTLSLMLRILKSLLLTLNIFHIINDVKYAEIRALYWKKEKKVISLTDCKPPLPTKDRTIKFVLRPYIRPRRNEILR